MKIVVVHGDDIEKSRKRFAQIVSGVKKRGWEVGFIEPSASIEDYLVNKTLFENESVFVIEEAKKLDKRSLDRIKTKSDKFDSQLLVYSRSKIPATFLKHFPKSAKLEEFSLPKLLFVFLDNLYPGNSKHALKLFEDLVDSENFELIIAMMGRTFRDLYWVLADPRTLSYPDWRKSKIRRQAAKFTRLELKDIINCLAEIDFKSKTSDIDARLLVEMLIIEKLA